jgi:hypothetical protein
MQGEVKKLHLEIVLRVSNYASFGLAYFREDAKKRIRAGSSRVSYSISRRPMVKDPEGAVVGEDSRLEEEGPCVETFG